MVKTCSSWDPTGEGTPWQSFPCLRVPHRKEYPSIVFEGPAQATEHWDPKRLDLWGSSSCHSPCGWSQGYCARRCWLNGQSSSSPGCLVTPFEGECELQRVASFGAQRWAVWPQLAFWFEGAFQWKLGAIFQALWQKLASRFEVLLEVYF